MRFVDEFRDADKAHALAAKIAALCEPGRQYKLMEVCGGHTHTIYKHGLEDYLPESITLVHGPGCPVCVIPMGRVDDAIHLASQPDVIMTSFGDMMRVPGSGGSFFDANAEGTHIRMVYSPLDSLKIARQLAAFGGRNDIAVGLSTSGNSANLLRAFDEASRRGMLTIGLAGYDGGRMAELDSIDYLFVVPSSSVHRIQEAQTTIYQVLWQLTAEEVSHVPRHTR